MLAQWAQDNKFVESGLKSWGLSEFGQQFFFGQQLSQV